MPLNTTDFPNGAYMQDLDNELPFWIGTWVGETNNRKLTLTFTFFQKQHFIDGSENYYKDKVVGKFKVEDLLTNTVLYDTSSASQYNEYPVNTSVFRNIALSCIFQDDASRCFNTATFKLFKISGEQNQVQYKAFSRNSYNDLPGNCPQYDDIMDIPMPLPTTDLILYRQP